MRNRVDLLHRSARAAGVAALLAIAAPLGGSAASAAAEDRSAPILSAIERLESQRDAKCHSTASRFEDFLYGTPLSEAARFANADLQGRLALRLWSRGSRVAAGSGDATVGASHLQGGVDELFASVEQGGDGQVRVAFPGGHAVEIPARRLDQYGSIAYSLRAILSVQQDLLFAAGEKPLPLAPDGVETLRETLDLATLSALELADRGARERSEFDVTESGVREAWQRLFPGLAEESVAPETPAPAPDPADVATARAESLRLLEEIADGKAAAYRAYNDLDERDSIKLLVFNISRFYARQPLSRYRAERRTFVKAFEGRLDTFATALLAAADARARGAGRPLVRAEDASAAVARLVPHAIDEFEDVHVFPRLPESERVVLEAFDCDSLRDFGLHWPPLLRAARALPPGSALPDPMAAEILAEAVSQYGVLLLRLAGEEARRGEESIRLAPEHLVAAAAEIGERARRDRAAPEPAPVRSAIVSAPAADAAGGPGHPFFRDATAGSGVDFTHRSARWLGEFRHKQLKTPPTFSGGGVAAEDVDGDGDVDLLFVGGAGNALYLQEGPGRFTDATERAGIVLRRADGSYGEPRQPLIADFDNDGDQDILVTYVDDDHRLFRNVGDGRFEDVSTASGLGGKGLVGGPATAFDFDGDGLLDVYVAYFGDYLDGAIPTFERDNRNGLPNRLFRNKGGLRFEDVTAKSGADDTGWTQAVSHTDFDRDGRQDLIVANDYGRNAFLRNLGSGRFENVAPALGITKAFHSMNVGIADLNDDDYPDVYVSNIATLVKDDKYSFPDGNTPLHFDLRALAGMLVKESDVLYMSRLEGGRLAAYEPSRDVERGETSTGWAWDAEFLDFDHDGDDDLYVVNGTNDFNTFSMVYRRFHEEGKTTEHVLDHKRESNVFYRNEGGRLRNVSGESGADLVANSRSTAYLDFDGDGDLDVAVNNFHAKATLLRNDAAKQGGWLELRLVGDPERGVSRDAIGARITVTTADGTRRHREIQGGSGYLSMNPKRQHVGVGASETADVRIVWPNGEVQTLAGLSANAAWTVRQGVAVAERVSSPRVVRAASGR